MPKFSWRRLVLAVVAGAGIYALAGFVLAPIVVERGLTTALARHTGGDVVIGRVTVNPLSLTVTVKDLAVNGPGAVVDARVARVTWRHPPAYLFTPGWSAAELSLDAPRLSMQAASGWQDKAIAALSGGSRVAIARLTVTDGEVHLVGQDRSQLLLSALHLDGENLGTDPERRGAFTLSGVVDHGGTLSAEGSLTLSPTALDASVNLVGVDIAGVNIAGLNIAGVDIAGIDKPGAASTAGGDVTLASGVLAGKAKIHLDDQRTDILGDFSLGQVSLVDVESGEPVFSADEVAGKTMTVQFAPLTVSAESLRIAGAQLSVARAGDGTLRGVDWFRPLLGGPASVFPSTRRIEVADSRMTFADFAVAPSFQLAAKNINGTVGTVRGGTTVSVSLQGQLTGAGTGRVDASWLAGDPARSGIWRLAVADLDASRLSPYLAAIAGREIVAGQLNLTMTGAVNDRVVDITHSVGVTGLELGEGDSIPAATNRPLDLAIALLEDADGGIRVDVPLPAVRLGDQVAPLARFRDGLDAVVLRMTEAPIEVLAGLADPAGVDLGRVAFDAGSAALNEAASEALATLAAALARRPRLGVQIVGRYDPVADRNALAREQMNLHIALATSAGAADSTAQTTLDFSDPRVISILEEFAGERLRPQSVAAIRARFPGAGPRYYEAVYEALVGAETVSDRAVKSLARFRARAVVGALAANQIAAERFRVGSAVEAVDAQDGAVNLEIGVWY